MLLEMAYAGSHGTHMMGYTYNLNQLDPQYQALGLQLDDRVPNPFFGLIPPGPSKWPDDPAASGTAPVPGISQRRGRESTARPHDLSQRTVQARASVLDADTIVFTREALARAEEVYA